VGHEAAPAAEAIKAKLAANGFLTAVIAASKHFAESAPQNTDGPFIVFRMRSPGEDSQVLPDRRAMASPLFDVGAWVADNPYSPTAQTAAKQIDVSLGALAHYSVTDANGDVWEVSARRESMLLNEEIDLKAGGKKFYWVGGSYRFSISQS
jgi:hypothetical protein